MSEQNKRVAIYARVSTNKDQRPEAQIDELRKYCAARCWAVVAEIVDQGFSGKTDQRPGLKQLMNLARRRHIDVVVVAKLDRLARSLKHLINTLDEWNSIGVSFVAINSPFDFTSSMGKLMTGVIACFAEFERDLIAERTRSGLAIARAKGIKLGRPPSKFIDDIRRLKAEGLSNNAIKRKLGVSNGVLWRALKGDPKTPQNSASTDPVVAPVSNAANQLDKTGPKSADLGGTENRSERRSSIR
ncbi:MAG: recombinase family protein [Oligoflexales bacterium]